MNRRTMPTDQSNSSIASLAILARCLRSSKTPRRFYRGRRIHDLLEIGKISWSSQPSGQIVQTVALAVFTAEPLDEATFTPFGLRPCL